MNAIEAKNLGIAFSNDWIFRNINVAIEEGVFAAIVGPNGSGKSTFLRIVTRLIEPTEGEVFLYGQPVKDFSNRSHIGYISQAPIASQKRFPITAKEIVELGILPLHKSILPFLSSAEKDKVYNAMKTVDVWHLRNHLIGDLSGGQKQRVLLARALAAEAKLLLLDEPTSGIDADAKKEIYSLLKNLCTEQGTTIVMISHDMDLATQKTDKILCLESGGICYWGDSTGFMAHRHKSGYFFSPGGLNNART